MPFNNASQSNERRRLNPSVTNSRKTLTSPEQRSTAEPPSVVKSELVAANVEGTKNKNTNSEKTDTAIKTGAVSKVRSRISAWERLSPMGATTSSRVEKKVKTEVEIKNSGQVNTLRSNSVLNENSRDTTSSKSKSVKGEAQTTSNEAKEGVKTACLLPQIEEKEIVRKQRARFEINTRRVSQAPSAAGLDVALASPDQHPIRGDKKEEREKRSKKFIGSSATGGLLSPTISNSNTGKSNSTTVSEENRERTQMPSPGTNQGNEAGFARATAPNKVKSEFTSTGEKKSAHVSLQPKSVDKLSVNRSNNKRSVTEVGIKYFPIESLSPAKDTNPSTPTSTPASTPPASNTPTWSSTASRSTASSVAANRTCDNRDRTCVPFQEALDAKDSTAQSPQSSTSSRGSALCPDCHQKTRTDGLESEVRRLKNLLDTYEALKLDDMEREKQARLKLLDRAEQLESKLTGFETLSKDYAKAKDENASLLRLLSDAVRSESRRSLQPSTWRSGAASSTAVSSSSSDKKR